MDMMAIINHITVILPSAVMLNTSNYCKKHTGGSDGKEASYITVHS